MKKGVYIIEGVLALIALLGWIWIFAASPMAELLLTGAMFSFSIFYLAAMPILVSKNKVETFPAAIGVSIAFAIQPVLLTILFRLMHWSGSTEMARLAIFGAIVAFVLILIGGLVSKGEARRSFLKQSFPRVFLFFALMLVALEMIPAAS